jgi:hypothetical protein
MAMLEETDAYVGRLADFLAGVEKAIVKVEA